MLRENKEEERDTEEIFNELGEKKCRFGKKGEEISFFSENVYSCV